jgi:septum formation protein
LPCGNPPPFTREAKSLRLALTRPTSLYKGGKKLILKVTRFSQTTIKFRRKKMKLILASGSPRRSEILKNAGYEFVVKPTSADESLPDGILPGDAVKLLSERKADAAKIECSDVVLSADTVVALGDRILGKPSDKAEAFSMLRSLSGKTHSVYTGVTIKSAEKKRVFAVKTDVLFYPLTDDEINAYIATGEPFDKAGAYGIQGRAAVFVEKIDGDYYSVVGLPLSRCARALRDFGIVPSL